MFDIRRFVTKEFKSHVVLVPLQNNLLFKTRMRISKTKSSRPYSGFLDTKTVQGSTMTVTTRPLK